MSAGFLNSMVYSNSRSQGRMMRLRSADYLRYSIRSGGKGYRRTEQLEAEANLACFEHNTLLARFSRKVSGSGQLHTLQLYRQSRIACYVSHRKAIEGRL